MKSHTKSTKHLDIHEEDEIDSNINNNINNNNTNDSTQPTSTTTTAAAAAASATATATNINSAMEPMIPRNLILISASVQRLSSHILDRFKIVKYSYSDKPVYIFTAIRGPYRSYSYTSFLIHLSLIDQQRYKKKEDADEEIEEQ
ncbi:hypothetical protein DFA_06114 [Cavenderia fasciculata]|uniref:Uncharacterized protein n=1 Tax=Cavenderia fasciculata TaxID=261658 RepID=F4PK52_CACFS|nr:uncharacterized protein DFA_06114 [Cavenderia fasciculata]EGG23976.1 hypothetical protein DFA_06114 [Cavenderia fasciculata]|eukprot:XP_004361827.1 hypothetical protein DFA_06114 [Cavenderia fasciculata]